MEKQVHFKNHLGEKLTGTLHQPGKPSDGGIIIGHCFTCSRHTRVLQQMGRELAAARFTVLRFDFSGNGQSEGAFIDSSYAKHIAEMKTAAAFLSANSGVRWIGLAGHSTGGNIALLAGARLKSVRAFCLLASRISGMKATHFLSTAQQTEIERSGRVFFTSRGRSLEISKDFFADAGNYDMLKVIGSLKRPLLVIHGDRDEIVPMDEALQAHKLNPAAITLKVIPGADHMFSQEDHRSQVAEVVADWFTRQLHKKHDKA
ncbi:MAG: alpha/beta fold hydrolase [Desulfobacterales bacterium]|nr:alpha/beta fold hydrolase [Desulfobacterales bacterium]